MSSRSWRPWGLPQVPSIRSRRKGRRRGRREGGGAFFASDLHGSGRDIPPLLPRVTSGRDGFVPGGASWKAGSIPTLKGSGHPGGSRDRFLFVTSDDSLEPADDSRTRPLRARLGEGAQRAGGAGSPLALKVQNPPKQMVDKLDWATAQPSTDPPPGLCPSSPKSEILGRTSTQIQVVIAEILDPEGSGHPGVTPAIAFSRSSGGLPDSLSPSSTRGGRPKGRRGWLTTCFEGSEPTRPSDIRAQLG